MGNQMTSITLFGTTYELPVIKDEQFESLQTAIREHREVLSVDEKKRGILGLFAKKESLSAEERLRRMESLVTHYDELINLLRFKISACRQVFEAIGDGVEAEFLRKLDTLEKLEQDRQRLAANFIKAGHSESAAIFEEQRQNIRNMVTNLSRSAILILKKLRHALDALETLASNDEKQRMVYENLKNDVGLYRQYYDFNQKMAAVQQEIAQLTNIALEFDNILRDNLGPLGILVDQISQIDSRLSESLVEIEKLSAELEKGNTSTEALSLVSDRLVSSIISGRMRSDVISDILEQLRNPTSDTDQIDFNLKLAESVSDELDFAALAENMRILVKTGIHALALPGVQAAPGDPVSIATPEHPASAFMAAPGDSSAMTAPGDPTGIEGETATKLAMPTAAAAKPSPTHAPASAVAPASAAPAAAPPASAAPASAPPVAAAVSSAAVSAASAWTPPPPRSEHSSIWKTDRPLYRAAISRAHPTLVVFLLDQSGSMETRFTGTLSRAQFLSQVVNRTIEELCTRCNRPDGIRDYFDIAILGYGNDRVVSLLSDMIPGSMETEPWGTVPWIQISTLARKPQRITNDAQGIPHPHWISIQHEGNTPMRQAFETTCRLVADWCDMHPDSYPPTVINITDGESTDGSPRKAADLLQQLHTKDGPALLFNLHVGEGSHGEKPVVFPDTTADLDEYGSLLYVMSSPMPPHLLQAARAEGFAVTEQSRFFAYGAGADLATRFLNLGTRPGKLY